MTSLLLMYEHPVFQSEMEFQNDADLIGEAGSCEINLTDGECHDDKRIPASGRQISEKDEKYEKISNRMPGTPIDNNKQPAAEKKSSNIWHEG